MKKDKSKRKTEERNKNERNNNNNNNKKQQQQQQQEKQQQQNEDDDSALEGVPEGAPPIIESIHDCLNNENNDDETSLWPTPNNNNVRYLDIDLSLSDDSSPPSLSADFNNQNMMINDHHHHSSSSSPSPQNQSDEMSDDHIDQTPTPPPPTTTTTTTHSKQNKHNSQQDSSKNNNKPIRSTTFSNDNDNSIKSTTQQQQQKQISNATSLSKLPTAPNNVKPVIQVQHFDNNTIQTLIAEQTKSHLIIDDEEKLQINNAAEFIALFPAVANMIQQQQQQQKHKTNKQQQRIGNNYSELSSSNNSIDDDLMAQQAQNNSEAGRRKSSTSSTNSTISADTMVNAATILVDDKLVKCVAIFGNTGDGKSHTLNHTFFDGRQIFRTWHKQETCTVGIWCAYDARTNALIFDTEGLLGETLNENKRMRLLLKVLAISDVIIYRTRGERLHNDLFKFLSDASVAYLKYFSKELKVAANKLKLDTISSLGPCCIIFHETQHTEPLQDEIDTVTGNMRTVNHQIADRFAKIDGSYNAFSSLDYVGTRTCFNNSQTLLSNVSTDFTKLAQAVRVLLRNNSVRPPRKLSSIYHVLKVLNDKFNGVINKNQLNTFADEYFTCSAICLSCGKRCQNSINHLKDSILHENSEKCHYDHQYDNRVYVCKFCHEAGKELVVIPKTAASNENSLVGIVKYALSGFVLECPHHGIIYRSRQYWYGNQDPESVVRTELKHIWSGQQNHVGTSHNLSRKIIDGVSYIGESLHSVSAKPTKLAMQWMSDQVAPTYWIPNSDIVACHKCEKPFVELLEKKHHCRGCGKGFCDKCSSKRMVISWWSPTDKVRVCDECFIMKDIPEPIVPITASSVSVSSSSSSSSNSNNSSGHHHDNYNDNMMVPINQSNDATARKVTETVQETIGYIGYATKLPFDVLKESARPSYWKPDSECPDCFICHKEFDDLLPLHHCRSCGNGICNNCSPHLRPVPSRGWDTPVRVCNNCVSNVNTEEEE